MRYFNWKTTKIFKHWGLRLQIPYCLRRLGASPSDTHSSALNLRTSCFLFRLWIHKIPYAPACHYKYTSMVPVQMFYSFILIKVNKKFCPSIIYPCLAPPPKKKFFSGWLRAWHVRVTFMIWRQANFVAFF